MTLILNRNDVISLLDMKDCIDAVEKAFAELSNGTAVLPLRTAIKPEGGISLYMPSYLKEMGALACKVVSVYKNNPSQYNLPTTIGKVLVQDEKTGDVVCIMDGSYLTAVRTGAASGVATKYLARDDKGQSVGIFGAGVQARNQLWAITCVRNINKAVVYDLNDEVLNIFIKEMTEKLKIDITKSKSIQEVIECNIICTATSSSVPLFDGSKVKEGTHLNGIGSHTPDARELDSEIVKRSVFVGDSLEACFNEAGDIMIPLKEGSIKASHFYAELGEIVTGKKPGRRNNKDITLFKSNGLAIQDAATAHLVYKKALEKKIGMLVDI
ncbi:MAG TPA: ornithine cyclodeaminase family protein [Ignavibacteria bacterium]